MKISKPCAECLSLFEMFRRLNFPADDIFFDCYPAESVVQVRVQKGESAFRADVPLLGVDSLSFKEKMDDAILWWNTSATHEDRREVYLQSDSLSRSMEMLSKLREKGMWP